MDAKDHLLRDLTVQIDLFLFHNYEPMTQLQSTINNNADGFNLGAHPDLPLQ